MGKQAKEAPQEGAQPGTYTIKVPLDLERTKFAEFEIRELDEDTFKAASSIWANDDMKATWFLLKELRVSGDPVSVIEGNLTAKISLKSYFLKITQPLEVEVKKN